MRFDGLDLNLLVALDSLLQLRSVSQSARRLCLSQPAMTGALNRLRIYFRDDLLVAQGRKMVPTARARELQEPIRRALTLIRTEITQSTGFDPATSTRRFTIVASDYAYDVMVADLVFAAAALAPAISFEILTFERPTMEQFDLSEIDLAVVVRRFVLADHPYEAVWTDEAVAVSWAGAGYRIMDEDTFFGAPQVVATFGSARSTNVIEMMLQRFGRHRTIELVVPSFRAVPQAIVGTRRIAALHRRHAEHFARHHPLTIHPFPVAIPPITEVIQWHAARDNDQGVQWLIGLFRQRAALLQPGPADPPGRAAD